MSTMELRAELFQNINPLLDNEGLLRETLDFIKGLLSREKTSLPSDKTQPNHNEKIEADLREAFKELKDYKDGKIEFQSAEDFLKEWEDE